MIECIKKLTGLGMILEDNLCADLVLQSLLDSFSQFIINLNINKLEVTLSKLLNMLREAEKYYQEREVISLYWGDYKEKESKKVP